MFDMMPYGRRERGMFDLFNDLDRYFFGPDPFMEEGPKDHHPAKPGDHHPMHRPEPPMMGIRTDIKDNGDAYLLSAELPGYDREDITLNLENDVLTIRAEHNEDTEEKDKDGYVCRERRFGSCSRSFNVENIRQDDIRASYKNGVLELTLPKKEQEPLPAARTIAIE